MKYFIVLALLALAACAHHSSAPAATPPPLLLDQRGIIMPLQKAVTHIGFRPFIPSTQILAYAVLPPIGGADTNANRGLGIEYDVAGRALLLSQWPKQRFNVAFVGGGGGDCAIQHYSLTGLAWVTPRNMVLTLQPDGTVPPAFMEAEARRLIRSGACPKR